MGGGDLNSKKSWHPNTMKNQERVWKAEKAAAEEKKRIAELQIEHAQERTREELNEMAKKRSAELGSTTSDDRLHWMYNKPEKSVQHEDYLLGKEIEKNYDQPEKSDFIPAVARRVVGSSMLATAGDVQVDLARKIREDPLLLVKERERAARAALLNNPLHRRRITDLLKKEQMQKLNEKKNKKKNLDSMLADKLNALGKDEGLDLAALLASDSDDTSSDSEKKSKSKRKKFKKGKKSKKSKKEKKAKNSSHQSESDSDSRINKINKKKQPSSVDQEKNDDKEKSKSFEISKSRHRYQSTDSDSEDCRERHHSKKKRKSENEFSGSHDKKRRFSKEQSKDIQRSSIDRHKRDERKHHSPERHKCDDDRRRYSPERSKNDEFRRRNSPGRYNRQKGSETSSRKPGLSEEEKLARLAEMAAAGAARETERSRRVERQRRHCDEDGARPPAPAAPALPHSLEARIHSNRHYIQRDKRHMNENFARR